MDQTAESGVNHSDVVSKVQTTATTSSESVDKNKAIVAYSHDDSDETSLIDSDSGSEVADEIFDECKDQQDGMMRGSELNQPFCNQSSSNINTNIVLQNSSDVKIHNGNTTIINAPLTINRIVNDKSESKHDASNQKLNNLKPAKSADVTQSTKDKSFKIDQVIEIKENKRLIYKLLVISGVIVGALFCSALASILLQKNYSGSLPMPPNNETTVKTVDRNEWGAMAPSLAIDLPSYRVIIAHTAGRNCSTQAECMPLVRAIQAFHIQEKGWYDIAYNFLIGGDGAVYIGRGWDIKGSHTEGYNEKSICIAFIGNYNNQTPTVGQIYAAQKIIEKGIKLKKLTEGYRLQGQCQLRSTESPGAKLYDIIKK